MITTFIKFNSTSTHTTQHSALGALKPTTASTTFFTSSPSRYRMEGTSLALPAVGTLAGRAATSGQRVPVQLTTLAP